MKRWKTFWIMYVVIAGSLSIGACQQKGARHSGNEEATEFMKRIEAAAASKKEIVKAFHKPIAYHYEAENLRDPFALPALVKNKKFYPNTILRDVALDSLKLTGIVIHPHFRWAIFRANNGKVYKVTEGVRMGIQQALVTQIDPTRVVFRIDVDVGAETEKRDIVMKLPDVLEDTVQDVEQKPAEQPAAQKSIEETVKELKQQIQASHDRLQQELKP